MSEPIKVDRAAIERYARRELGEPGELSERDEATMQVADLLEWQNDVAELLPEKYDGDEAQEALILRAVKDMTSTIERVRALHAKHSIYDECDHSHSEGDEGVIDTGEFLTCAEEWMYDVCSECCADNPAWVEQSEVCATYHEHGKDKPICRTIAALDGEAPDE